MTGKFIAVEGGDGVGKTTQVKILTDALNDYGISAANYAEPGGTEAGLAIRDVIKSSSIPLGLRAQYAMICASRAQLWDEKLSKDISNGTWVILDRYLISSLVYQREFSEDKIARIADLFGFPSPDLYLFLDVDSEQALSRLDASVDDRFDFDGKHAERIEHFRRHANRVTSYGKGAIIDAGESPEAVAANIWKAVQKRFKL